MVKYKCANCELEDKEAELLIEFASCCEDTSPSPVTIRTALETVFEHRVQNQKTKTGATSLEGSIIKMCVQCTSTLAELYRFYVEFLRLTKHTSYVQLIVRQSILWHSNSNSEDIKPALPSDASLLKQEEILPDILGNQSQYDDDDSDDDQMLDPLQSDEDFEMPPTPTTTKLNRSIRFYKPILKQNQNTRLKPISGGSSSKSTLPKPSASAPKYAPKTKCDSVRNIYECLECQLVYDSYKKLRGHRQWVHATRYTCEHCNKEFHPRRKYDWHLVVAHGIGDKEPELICPVPACSKYFSTRTKLKGHTQTTHCPEQDKIPCPSPNCPARFPTHMRLNNHMAEVHEKGKAVHKCKHSDCDEVFPTKSKLYVHNSEAHKNRTLHECPHCHRTSIRPDFLRRHLPCLLDANAMKEPPGIRCDVCGKTFYKLRNLQRHQVVHSGVEACVCPESDCGRKFTLARSLARHMAAVHAHGKDTAKGPFVCETCGKAFKLQDYLTQHKRSKTHGGVGHGHGRLAGAAGQIRCKKDQAQVQNPDPN